MSSKKEQVIELVKTAISLYWSFHFQESAPKPWRHDDRIYYCVEDKQSTPRCLKRIIKFKHLQDDIHGEWHTVKIYYGKAPTIKVENFRDVYRVSTEMQGGKQQTRGLDADTVVKYIVHYLITVEPLAFEPTATHAAAQTGSTRPSAPRTAAP